MIKSVEIENFKCFKNPSKIKLANLTILSGGNGVGKSTVIQSLMLFRQSLYPSVGGDARILKKLRLNGSLVSLGEFATIASDGKNPIVFNFEFDKLDFDPKVGLHNFRTSLISEIGNSSTAAVKFELTASIGSCLNVTSSPEAQITPEELGREGFIPFIPEDRYSGVIPNKLRFSFLSASRTGPSSQNKGDSSLNPVNLIGNYGECAAQLWHGRDFADGRPARNHRVAELAGKVFELKKNVNTPLVDLSPENIEHLSLKLNSIRLDLVSAIDGLKEEDFYKAWMAVFPRFFPVILERHDDAVGASLVLHFIDMEGNVYSPHQVGFGLSYTFPIFVGLFMTEPGGMLIVENPEAHLHPAAQSALGRIISEVSNKRNIQVIIETHSDHFVNGVRIAVRNKGICNKQLSILYFQNSNTIFSAEHVNVNSSGFLTSWPAGFFDQGMKDSFTLNREISDE